MVIALTVPGNKWLEYVRCFVITHPNHTRGTDNPLNDEDWVRERFLLFARNSYEKGLIREYEALNGPVIDKDIIKVT